MQKLINVTRNITFFLRKKQTFSNLTPIIEYFLEFPHELLVIFTKLRFFIQQKENEKKTRQETLCCVNILTEMALCA